MATKTENGTFDGSTDYILESVPGGMYSGSKTGAGVGVMSGAFNLIANPEGFCFVAGTVVMTAVAPQDPRFLLEKMGKLLYDLIRTQK